MRTVASLARTLSIVAAIGASAALVCESAAARGGHGGRVVGSGGWHGGPGHFRGGHGGHRAHWGHRGHYRPGVFWGGVGVGIGVGAIGYYGAPYGTYYGAYYAAPYGYYAPYDIPYPDDPALIAVPLHGRVVGRPVPQVAAPDPIFYPKDGQSAETTESDRRECNRWATSQPHAMADASVFQRATLACMEGRGYTVR